MKKKKSRELPDAFGLLILESETIVLDKQVTVSSKKITNTHIMFTKVNQISCLF